MCLTVTLCFLGRHASNPRFASISQLPGILQRRHSSSPSNCQAKASRICISGISCASHWPGLTSGDCSILCCSQCLHCLRVDIMRSRPVMFVQVQAPAVINEVSIFSPKWWVYLAKCLWWFEKDETSKWLKIFGLLFTVLMSGSPWNYSPAAIQCITGLYFSASSLLLWICLYQSCWIQKIACDYVISMNVSCEG